MKLAVVTLFAILAVAHAGTMDVIDLEDLTAYNYLARVGLPLAEKIRKAEKDSMSRIVSGSAAALGAFPYHAGIISDFFLGQSVCSGALITTNRFLTAARCWWDGVHQVTSMTVVLGSTTLFYGGTRLVTTQVVMHGEWSPRFESNDIAVAKLASNVKLSSTIAIVALPSGTQSNELYIGERAVVTGFGRTGDDPSGDITINQFLSYVEMPVISNLVCFLHFPLYILESNVCTRGINDESTCEGDAGAPLVIERNGVPILIGLGSYNSGRGCELGFPSIFTRTTSYYSFINQHL